MVTFENVGEWQGESNVRMVKEILMIKQTDVVALLSGLNFADQTLPYSALVLKTAAVFERMKFAYDTCQFSETAQLTPNGAMYNVSFSFEIPKNRADITTWLQNNTYNDFLVLFRDGNGECYISGDMQTALRISSSRAVGSKNVCSVGIDGQLRQRSYNIAGVDESQLSTAVEFSPEFSFDFFS